MRRFGGREAFLGLLDEVRARVPQAGIRSNVIVGFPGETEDDLAELEAFLLAARLDVVGVFGYSDEDGTEAESYGDKLPEDVVAERVSRFTALIEELNVQRAEERIGEQVDVLVESVPTAATTTTRPRWSAGPPHQGPDVDGVTLLTSAIPRRRRGRHRDGPWSPAPRGSTCWPSHAERVRTGSGPGGDPGRRCRRRAPWNIANALTVPRILLVPVYGWLLLFDGGATPACAGRRPASSSSPPSPTASTATSPGARPDHRLRQDRRPDRRQDADGHGLRRPVGRSTSSPGGSPCVMLVREWGVTVLRFFVIRHGVMPASRGGKAKTTLQFFGLLLFTLPLASFSGADAWTTVADVIVGLAVASPWSPVSTSRSRRCDCARPASGRR